jgi:hypothetical protein
MTLENGKLQCYSKVDKKEEYKKSAKSYKAESCIFIIESVTEVNTNKDKSDWQDHSCSERLVIFTPERQNRPMYMYAHPKELQRLMAAICLA